MKKRKLARFTAGEKMVYCLTIFSLIGIFLIKIFCGAGISNLKMSVEKIQYKVNNQKKTNESLTMKVNELTSFENIKKVIDEQGLAYNNENIIIIEK